MINVSKKVSEEQQEIDNFINEFTKKIIESVDHLCDIFYDQAFKTYPLVKSLQKNQSYSIYDDDEEENNNEDNLNNTEENLDLILYDKIAKVYGLWNKKYAKVSKYKNFTDLISGTDGVLFPLDYQFKDITIMNDIFFIVDENNVVRKIKDDTELYEHTFDKKIVRIDHTNDNKIIIIQRNDNVLYVELYNQDHECLETNSFNLTKEFKTVLINDDIVYLVDLIENNSIPFQPSFYNDKSENNQINLMCFISISQKKLFTFHKNPISLFILDDFPLSDDFKIFDNKLFFISSGRIVEYDLFFTNNSNSPFDENIVIK